MSRGVAFQLVGDADLQMSPLVDELSQLIALLPALQPVLADLLALDLLAGRILLAGPRPDRVG